MTIFLWNKRQNRHPEAHSIDLAGWIAFRRQSQYKNSPQRDLQRIQEGDLSAKLISARNERTDWLQCDLYLRDCTGGYFPEIFENHLKDWDRIDGRDPRIGPRRGCRRQRSSSHHAGSRRDIRRSFGRRTCKGGNLEFETLILPGLRGRGK